MTLEDRLDKLISLLEAILYRFAPQPTDPRNTSPFVPTTPPFWNTPSPVPTVPPEITGPPIVTPGGDIWDSAYFDWDHPGSWRRFFGGRPAPLGLKYLVVPVGFDGRIRLEITQTTGNMKDLADVVVTEGPRIVTSQQVSTVGDDVFFDAVGGTTYGVACDTPGAVLSINYRR